MLELRPTPQATVSPGVPSLLQEGYYVKFTDQWPASLSHVTYQSGSKTRGKFFQVQTVNQVPFDISHIIPTGDFRDVDFSNVISNFNENLYPANPKTLYETALGFKPGNFLAHFYIPAGEYTARLEQANMVPNVANATLRYVGARKYEDSPYEDKRIFLYSVFNLDALIMRLFVDSGVDFEKVIAGIVVNKCLLLEQPTWEQAERLPEAEKQKYYNNLSRAKKIKFYSELRW